MAVVARQEPAAPARRDAARFPLVDSLRAIAALTILVYHGLVRSGALDAPTLVAPVAARLDVGVTIFFVISGFLLYRPFVRTRLDGERHPRTAAYAWRRALRIVPAYWVALAVSGVVLGLHYLWTPGGLLQYFGFAQNYSKYAILRGLPQAWTLGVEVTFYAFLPLYALALRRLAPRGARAEWAGLAVLVAVALTYKAVLVASAPDPAHANAVLGLEWLPAFLDHFALGMALAVLSCTAPAALARVPPWAAWSAALAAFLVACFGIGMDGVGNFTEPTTAAQVLARHVLFGLVGAAMVLPAVTGPSGRGLIRRLLGTRWMLWLGLVSYGIYLWHVTVIDRIDHWDLPERLGVHPYVVYVGLGFAGTVLLAWASWTVVERPALRLKRRVPDRVAPPRDAVNAGEAG